MAARTHTAVENMRWVVRDVVGVLNGRRRGIRRREAGKGVTKVTSPDRPGSDKTL
jgi:hypothetical protein